MLDSTKMECKVFLSFLLLGLFYIEANSQALPDIDAVDAIKDKCEKLGGAGTYEKLKAAKDKFQTCTEDLIDFDTVQKELEDAKPTGSMDEVFGKYCNKRSTLRKCSSELIDIIKTCLDDNEREALNTTLNVLKELGEFACYRNGDRLAMFVAEKGIDCIKEHDEGIKNCINKTFNINTSSINKNSIPNLLINKEKCDGLSEIRKCVVQDLEKCKDKTPANIVDALFKFIKNHACVKPKTRRNISKRSIFSQTPTYLNNVLDTYIMYMEPRCTKNQGENGYSELQKSVNKSKECISAYLSTKSIFSSPTADLKTAFSECSDDLIEKSEGCLNENEKFYPKLSRDITIGLIELILKYNKNITLTSLSTETILCFQNFRIKENKQKLISCFQEDSHPSEYTKEFICKRLSESGQCISNTITKVCIRDIAIDAFKTDFQQIFVKPCEE